MMTVSEILGALVKCPTLAEVLIRQADPECPTAEALRAYLLREWETEQAKDPELCAAIEKVVGEFVEALRQLPTAKTPDPNDPQPVADCRRPFGCVCGGDTPGVRAGCNWWAG